MKKCDEAEKEKEKMKQKYEELKINLRKSLIMK